MVYYSPKLTMEGQDSYQKFTSIDIMKDDVVYQVDISDNFKPFRRNIDYFEANHLDIKPLIPSLAFIKNKSS